MPIISCPRTMDSNSSSIYHVTLPFTLPRVTIASLLLLPSHCPYPHSVAPFRVKITPSRSRLATAFSRRRAQ